MSEFQIKPNNLKNTIADIKNINQSLKTYPRQINKISSNLKHGMMAGYNFDPALSGVSDSIRKEIQSVTQLHSSLESIIQLYQETENKISGTLQKNSGKDNNENKGKSNSGSGAFISGKISKDGKIAGVDSHGEVSGELGGYSWKKSFTTSSSWKEKKDNNGRTYKAYDSLTLLSATLASEAHIAKGALKGNFGLLRGEAEGSVGEISGSGHIDATLISEGKFTPQVGAGVKASAVGVKGGVKGGIGTENNNIHVGAEGKAGVAEAEVSAGIGKIAYENDDGTVTTAYGVQGEAGAEAYVAEGEVSGGLDIMGVKVDVGLKGKLGGAGAKAGGHISTGGVTANASLGFLAGVGLDVSIDWTNFKWKW